MLYFSILACFIDSLTSNKQTPKIVSSPCVEEAMEILCLGGHLVCHLKYFNFPWDAKVAPLSFSVRIYDSRNIVCGLWGSIPVLLTVKTWRLDPKYNYRILISFSDIIHSGESLSVKKDTRMPVQGMYILYSIWYLAFTSKVRYRCLVFHLFIILIVLLSAVFVAFLIHMTFM